MKPTSARPASSIAHSPGSGTGVTWAPAAPPRPPGRPIRVAEPRGLPSGLECGWFIGAKLNTLSPRPTGFEEGAFDCANAAAERPREAARTAVRKMAFMVSLL